MDGSTIVVELLYVSSKVVVWEGKPDIWVVDPQLTSFTYDLGPFFNSFIVLTPWSHGLPSV